MRPYSPGGALNALATAQQGSDTRCTQCPPLTAWTTRVSNPVCSPRFRVRASVLVQEAAFATGVPPDIYEFHFYTGNSASLSQTQAWQFRMHFWGWAPGFHSPTRQATYTRFTPSDSEQRWHSPYYRGCWHGVSQCFLTEYRRNPGLPDCFFPRDRTLQPEGLLRPRGVAASGFPPLRKIPHCCLP